MSDTKNYFHTGTDDVFGDGGVRERRIIQALIDHMQEIMPTGFFANNDMLDWIKPDAWMIMETSIRSETRDWEGAGGVVRRTLVGTTSKHRLSCKHGHGDAEVIEKDEVVVEVKIKELSRVTFGKPPVLSSRPPSIEEMHKQKMMNEEELLAAIKERKEESWKASKVEADHFARSVSQPESVKEPTWGTW